MTETEQDGTRAFYDTLGSVRGLERLTSQYDDGSKQDKNLKDIKRIAYEDMRARGVPVPKSADEIDPNEARALVFDENGVKGNMYRQATEVAKANLGSIVAKADPDALQGLLGEKDLLKYAPRGYEKWAQKYNSFAQMADLTERVKKGSLKSEEEKALRNDNAAREAKKVKEQLKKEGASIEMQDKYAGLMARIVLSINDREALAFYAQEKANESLKELEAYEKENKQNIYGFISGALKNMLEEPKEISRKALGYLGAIEAKEPKKKAA